VGLAVAVPLAVRDWTSVKLGDAVYVGESVKLPLTVALAV
jgi:hypothetical protein